MRKGRRERTRNRKAAQLHPTNVVLKGGGGGSKEEEVEGDRGDDD